MKRALQILSLVGLCMVCAGVAYAAEHGGGGEAGAHPIPWMNFLWRCINFAIFVWFLWKFGGKKIGDFFKGRQYQIKTELADLETRRKEAEARLHDVERSIANIEQERVAILDEYRAQGEALKESIVAKAEKTAEQIKSQAVGTAAMETKVALDQVRADLADMVVEAAQKILQKRMTKEEHEKLVDDYLTKVVLH